MTVRWNQCELRCHKRYRPYYHSKLLRNGIFIFWHLSHKIFGIIDKNIEYTELTLNKIVLVHNTHKIQGYTWKRYILVYAKTMYMTWAITWKSGWKQLIRWFQLKHVISKRVFMGQMLYCVMFMIYRKFNMMY